MSYNRLLKEKNSLCGIFFVSNSQRLMLTRIITVGAFLMQYEGIGLNKSRQEPGRVEVSLNFLIMKTLMLSQIEYA